MLHWRMHCGLCKASFKTEPDLRIHNLVRHDTSFLICGHRHSNHKHRKEKDFCKFQFRTKAELKTHLKAIAWERKPCEICAATFSRKTTKATVKFMHMVFVHKVGDLFICGQCDSWFAHSVDGLREHEKKTGHHEITHHSTLPHISLDGTVILCKICRRKFESVKSLVQHIREKHGDILANTPERARPFKCNFCEKRFPGEYGRKSHTAAKHSQKIEIKQEPQINDAMGELDSKMDLKFEIKTEPTVKHEYFEDILDMKLEDCYGEGSDLTVKKEDKDDVKAEADLNTFTGNEGTFGHLQRPKESRNDNEDP